MQRRRVAITGVGMVTPLGLSAPATWEALLAGHSGIAPIGGFDASGFPVRIAGEVTGFDPASAIGDRKLLRFATRWHCFALAAADEALRDAGARPEPATAATWGCVLGTGVMGVDFNELRDFSRQFATAAELDLVRLAAAGGRAADPRVFCRSQVNAGLSLLLERHGIRGYASSVHTACASGGQAVEMAAKAIRRGVIDAALAGGVDSMVSPIGLAGFCLLGALSTDNETPERASRPFDATRNGFVLGEGAGILVLEEWEAARRRGAAIYAELAGAASSLSSFRITDTAPSGDGPMQAMRRALADADLAAREVDYLNAHGTSTLMNDRSECAAVRAVFGAHADRMGVSSTKSVMGHLIAAAGGVEVAICALVVRHGVSPASANLAERDPDCDLGFIVGAPRVAPVRAAMSNSFGFGGSNSALVLRQADA